MIYFIRFGHFHVFNWWRVDFIPIKSINAYFLVYFPKITSTYPYIWVLICSHSHKSFYIIKCIFLLCLCYNDVLMTAYMYMYVNWQYKIVTRSFKLKCRHHATTDYILAYDVMCHNATAVHFTRVMLLCFIIWLNICYCFCLKISLKIYLYMYN